MARVDQVEVPARVRTPQPSPGRPEIVEVDVERIGSPPGATETDGAAHGWPRRSRPGFLSRVWDAVSPVLLGILIDLGDALTPLFTVPFSIPVGMFVGYMISGLLRVPPTWRMVITAASGFYWAVPFTEAVPLATAILVVVQIVRPDGVRDEPFG